MTAADKIRVGIIGASPGRGFASIAHIPALQALPEFEITAVCTTRQASAEAAAKYFNIPLAFSDPRQLAQHPEVDLVTVCVKVPDHYQPVMAAIDAGKHVYCEWPLGRDTDEAIRMRDAAERRGIRHAVGLQGQVSPAINYARDLIAQGYVGRVTSATTVSTGGLGGPRVAESGLWLADARQGATILTISGGHVLGVLARAVGEFRQVSATVSLHNPTVTVVETGEEVPASGPDQVAIDGLVGDEDVVASVTVQGGLARAPGSWFFQIAGTDGALTIASADPGASIHMANWAIRGVHGDGPVEDLVVPDTYLQVPAAVPVGPPRNVAALYLELARALNESRPATPDFAAAVRFHRVVEAVQRASDTGARQTVS
jgi:predicted dehydrogenase